MAAHHSATFWAFPLRFLSLEERIDALVSDTVKILDLAHSELRPVPLVDGRKRFTRESRALVAVLHLVLPEQDAFLLQERTGLVPWSTPYAIHHPDALALDVMCDREICCAHIAVHAARRD